MLLIGTPVDASLRILASRVLFLRLYAPDCLTSLVARTAAMASSHSGRSHSKVDTDMVLLVVRWRRGRELIPHKARQRFGINFVTCGEVD